MDVLQWQSHVMLMLIASQVTEVMSVSVVVGTLEMDFSVQACKCNTRCTSMKNIFKKCIGM